ncbi:hypothetical protein ABEV74_09655 [Paenibacillus cisolokensis]|uniref:putative amidoligase domain-containing protein n=1 Tax=Paenibacillus cisolokensis TaxID=1658519 RepID=UPI003D2D0867
MAGDVWIWLGDSGGWRKACSSADSTNPTGGRAEKLDGKASLSGGRSEELDGKASLSGGRASGGCNAAMADGPGPDDAIVVWGGGRPQPGHPAYRERGMHPGWVLNAHAGDLARLPDGEWRRRLKRAGLSVSDGSDDQRVYRVPVFHLQALAVRRLYGPADDGAHWRYGGGAATELPPRDEEAGRLKDPLLRRAAAAAVKALYALGLDFGEVLVAVDGGGRAAIRSVQLPGKRLYAGGLWGTALDRFAAWHRTVRLGDGSTEQPLLIGADPEFVLLRADGTIASADRYFRAAEAGTDAVLVRRRLLRPVAELRPEPQDNPEALAAELRRLLRYAASRPGTDRLRWAAGGMPVPGLALGGHIHLSGVPLTGRLLRLLDSYAAFPLAMVEDPAGRKRRPRYGALGDFRLQPHGGFEYRTLPSWLVSPAAARAAFALALLCAREAWTLAYAPAEEERWVQAYYAGDRSELAGCLDRLAAEMAKTDSYAALSRWIEPLLGAARSGKTWDERADIRAKWRIPPFAGSGAVPVGGKRNGEERGSGIASAGKDGGGRQSGSKLSDGKASVGKLSDGKASVGKASVGKREGGERPYRGSPR